MENKKKSKIQRLILAGGVITIIGLGLTFELVKVPMEKEVNIPATTSQYVENGQRIYTYSVPEGYQLRFDHNGNPIGYTMIETEVSLNEYITNAIKVK